MRKFAAVLLVALALAACNQPNDSGPRPLTGLSGSGSSYYIEGASSAKSMARAAVAESGAAGTLKKIEADGTTGAVKFFDESGAEVAVTVRRARALADGRLILAITYDAADSCVMADTVAGTLATVSPEPEGWDYARDGGGALLYAAQGALWRLDLSTLAASRLTPEGETVPSGVWFKATAVGYLATVPGSGVETYYATGALSGASGTTSLPDPATYDVIEGLDGTVYRVQRTGADIALVPYTETGTTGSFVAGASEALCTLPWTPATASTRLSSKRLTHELVLGWDFGVLRIVAGSGELSYGVVELPAGSPSFIGGLETLAGAEGATAYFAAHEGADATRYHVYAMSATTLTPKAAAPSSAAEILVDTQISALMPVGGKLFYVRDSGAGPETMVYDGTPPAIKYADGAVTIEAVK